MLMRLRHGQEQVSQLFELLERGASSPHALTPGTSVRFQGNGVVGILNGGQQSVLVVEAFEETGGHIFRDATIGYRIYLADPAADASSGAWHQRDRRRQRSFSLEPGQGGAVTGGVFYYTFRGDRSFDRNLRDLVAYVTDSRYRVSSFQGQQPHAIAVKQLR